MQQRIRVIILTAVFISISLAGVENSSAIPGVKLGVASWYSRRDKGIRKTTANMECFDDTLLTGAMWGVPFDTVVEVTNLTNGKSVIIRINDRGPAKRLVRRGRVIDLTREAFSRIAHTRKGLISVSVVILSEPPA